MQTVNFKLIKKDKFMDHNKIANDLSRFFHNFGVFILNFMAIMGISSWLNKD